MGSSFATPAPRALRRAILAAALALPVACASQPDLKANADGSFLITSVVKPGHEKRADRDVQKRARRYCDSFGQKVTVLDRTTDASRARATIHFRCV